MRVVLPPFGIDAPLIPALRVVAAAAFVAATGITPLRVVLSSGRLDPALVASSGVMDAVA